MIAAAAAPSLAPASAVGERIHGIDVSRFQGLIDWERVGETKNEFAFVQASRGSGDDCTVAPERCGPDEFYDRNYYLARQEGIRVGPYHRTFTGGEGHRGVRRDARREATVFLTEMGSLRDHDLLPVLDVETPFNGLTPGELRVWIRTWLDRVTRQLGVRPIIYTNNSSWQATGDTTEFAYAGHPLWVANWKVDEPLVPAANWAGLGWTVWQYRSDGRVPGIDGDVDRNRLRVPLRSISVGATDDP